ncbi:phosphoglycerate dehydrogenase [Treponema primitia ZAS-2]|uniref:Phosphoglycerate dehydrogenase n=1 Tax=Treponema primitia (strain ATCC BAA-887 / DSM 12427 / ZAS-2) TaxID=545694 RepID=F5YKG6_TREPZ|nr:hydroxyacid dehydrogenase [Treponema primitia]AEF84287.1 phosphoglycerate dehydrogenase [Treponema primitia ZAS-2]
MYKVLIPEDVDSSGKDYLLERGYEIKVGVPTDIETLKREIADADALLARIARFPEEVLAAGKKLKVIARHGVGVDTVAVDYAESQGIWVVNAPLSNGNTVAECAVAMIMALECDLIRLDRKTREGDWTYREHLKRRDLAGLTLGIVGFGRIGRMVAEKVSGLGMKILTYHPRKHPETPLMVEHTTDFSRILSSSDYLGVFVPSTSETRGMFNYAAFSAMKPSAYYINCARGDTYVEADLARALDEGRLAGAAVDVFDPEPRFDSPLYRMDQVIVTQHSAGLSVEANYKMSLDAAKGIDEILRGDKPTWPVNHPAHPRADSTVSP